MKRLLTVLLLLPFSWTTARADDDKFFLQDGQRLLFLGDSNTYAGGFINYLDAYLFTRFPDKKFELINLGLPSETVSGLSEPDHPWPRPCVHERLDRALAKTKPHVVVACYGMNDGIYYPFDEERFAKYQEGTVQLIDKVKKAGAKLVLMTPAPFDPLPLKDRVLPAGAEKYSYLKPYQDYDKVLRRYSDWLVSLQTKDLPVVDAHQRLRQELTRQRQATPKFFFSGDGIHPNLQGHRLICEQLLHIWQAQLPNDLDQPRFAELLKLVSQRQRLLGLAWLTEVGHKRPDTPKGLPLVEAQKKAAALETRIRELARPKLHLRLLPVK